MRLYTRMVYHPLAGMKQSTGERQVNVPIAPALDNVCHASLTAHRTAALVQPL